MKKHIVGWLSFALLAAGIGAVAYLAWQRTQEEKDAGKQKRGVAAVAVEAVMVKEESIFDRRTFTGTLRPWSSFDLAPKVGGRLEVLNYDVGDPVKGGVLIAKIDDTEYRQSLDQAEADLEVTRSLLSEAEVNLDQRRREYERQKTLTAKQVGTAAQFESVEALYKAQQATCRKNEAEVQRSQALLENARLKVSDCTISAEWDPKAPARYIGHRYVDVGALMTANQSMVSIVELDRLQALIYVIERDYPKLQMDQEVRLSSDAYPGKTFTGKIARISQVLEENTRQGAVRIEIENKDLLLKPGMFVRVELVFEHRDKAQVIPRAAVVKRDGKSGVFRLAAGAGKAHFVPVETGIVSGDMIEVVSPKLTYPVITLGNHLLSEGVGVSFPEAFKPAVEKSR